MSFEGNNVELLDSKEETNFQFSDIDKVITERGSTYSYLPNRSTQRYKEVDKSIHYPKEVLVYIPDFESVKGELSKEALDILGENEMDFHDMLQQYIHNTSKRVDIVNEEEKVVETNNAILEEGGPIYMAFGDDEKYDFRIPVSHLPKIGYATFDKSNDAQRGWTRHMGHKVTKIILKK